MVCNAVRSITYIHRMYIIFANNQVACSTDAPNSDDDDVDGGGGGANTGAKTGAVVGGVVGGLAGAILLILPIILLWFFYIRKWREKNNIASMEYMYTVLCGYI